MNAGKQVYHLVNYYKVNTLVFESRNRTLPTTPESPLLKETILTFIVIKELTYTSVHLKALEFSLAHLKKISCAF